MQTPEARFALDGVSVLHQASPGSTRATLSFRVGSSDESLTQRGITSLTALCAAAAGGIDSPSTRTSTSFTITSFTFAGAPDEVAHEIGALCHSLGSLDARLLQQQRSHLLARAKPHSPEHAELLRFRFGPTGWGSDALPYFGLASLGLEDVAEWSAQHFTAGNAVLALSGPRPANLRVPLVGGPRRAVTEPEALAGGYPAIGRLESPQLSLGGMVRIDHPVAKAATGVLATIVRGRTVRAISDTLGLPMAANTSALAVGPADVHLAIWSDSIGGQQVRASEVSIGALDRLAQDGVSEQEVDFYRDRRRGSMQDYARTSRGKHALLQQEAIGELLAVPWSHEQESTELADVDSALLDQQAQQLHESLLALLPDDVRARRSWREIEPRVPEWSAAGTAFRSRPAYRRSRAGVAPRRLYVGSEGVVLRRSGGAETSIDWSAVRLNARYDDGRRLLMDARSVQLDLLPEEWLRPESVAAAIDARTPAEVSVEMGPRRTPKAQARGVLDRVPPWLWLVLVVVGIAAATTAFAVDWRSDLTWLQTSVGVGGFVLAFVGVAFGQEVARSARLLRRPRGVGGS